MNNFEEPPIPLDVLQSCPKPVQDYIAALQNQLQNLQTQIDELKARLDQNSQNSSKPPSSDPPFKRPVKKGKTRSPQPKGGQVGHTRHTRSLLPTEEVDTIHQWWPPSCESCQAPLRSSDQLGPPLRHQVWEIETVRARVSEHQFYQCECSGCGTLTRHPHPPTVPVGNFGPRVAANVATLHGRYRLSMREVQALAADLWQVPLSLGAVADLCHKVSLALETSYEQTKQQVQNSPVNNVDETGWYKAGERAWLWVAVSTVAVVFMVARSRSRASFQALLGENYAGNVGSDRYNAYYAVEAVRHQLCWAHLIRNLRALGARAGPGGVWSEKCLSLSQQLFEVWQQFREGGGERGQMDRDELAQAMEPIRAAFKVQLEAGLSLGDGQVQAFSRQLLRMEERLWVFVKVPQVEPTNNAAERALRPAVIWRKTCFGSQSEKGCRFVERLLTIRATCQIQGRPLLDFVSESVAAHWSGQVGPNLFGSSATP